MRRSLALTTLMLATAVTALALVGGSAASAPSPYGKWKARMTKDALLDFGAADPRFVGMWRFELRRDGTYRAYNPLDGWAFGAPVAVSGKRLAFSRDPTCHNDGTTGGRAVYRWSIAKGKLRLTSVTPDPCGGRWQMLTIPVWSRA